MNYSYSYLFQPQLLVMFLLFMPVDWSHIKSIIIAFIVGLTFDFFFNSWGIHAFVCTFIGFVRYYFTKDIDKEISSRDVDNKIWTSKKSKTWKFNYYLAFTFLYHFLFIFIDTLGRNIFTHTLPAVITSSLIVLVLVLILENILFKPNRN